MDIQNAPLSFPNRRRFIKIAAAQTTALALGELLPLKAQKSNTDKLVTWRGIVLGAEASIQLHHQDPVLGRKILHDCLTEIKRLESIFSLYDSHSNLCRLNTSGSLKNPPVELREILTLSKFFGEATNGVFDITIHPVVEYLRSHYQGKTSKSPGLSHYLQLVDYRKLTVAADSIKLDQEGSAITLNGIAQGYITDRITELLRSFEITHTLVDLGEKRALDSHPSGRPWNLVLAQPEPGHVNPTIIQLNNLALSSSGGYGTPFDSSGKVHHLIDPRTGQSVNHHNAVHVLATSATTADALSTALATCRPSETGSILAQFPEAKAYFG